MYKPYSQDKDQRFWGILGTVLPLVFAIFIFKTSKVRRSEYHPMYSNSVI